jgi:hypothetical protein
LKDVLSEGSYRQKQKEIVQQLIGTVKVLHQERLELTKKAQVRRNVKGNQVCGGKPGLVTYDEHLQWKAQQPASNNKKRKRNENESDEMVQD